MIHRIGGTIKITRHTAVKFLADGEGFEPPEDLRPQRFSRPPHSTALPPIRNCFSGIGIISKKPFPIQAMALFYIIFYETQSQKSLHRQKTLFLITTAPWSGPNWLKNQFARRAPETVRKIF